MPACRQGILAGTVLAFARALGEYGATSMLIGYIPGRTATISTTVYQLWRTNEEGEALQWVLVNLAILRGDPAGGQYAGEEKQKGRCGMSLSVHIKKKLGDFRLSVDLEHPEGDHRHPGGFRLREEYDPEGHCRHYKTRRRSNRSGWPGIVRQ